MWKPYLKAAAANLPNALQILDPFHIAKNLNEAIDTIRARKLSPGSKPGSNPCSKRCAGPS